MANTQRYVDSVVRRFYGPHWLAFSTLLRVVPQTQGAFDKNGHMIGLQLPIDFNVEESTKSLRKMYSSKEDGVQVSCYLMGTRYFKFVFFDSTIAVSEDTDENVRKHT